MVLTEDEPVYVSGGAPDALRVVPGAVVESAGTDVARRAAGHGQEVDDARVHQEEGEGHQPTRPVYKNVGEAGAPPRLVSK